MCALFKEYLATIVFVCYLFSSVHFRYPGLVLYLYQNISNLHGSSREGAVKRPVLINICYSNDLFTQTRWDWKAEGIDGAEVHTTSKKIYAVDMKGGAVVTVLIEWLAGSSETYI